MAKRVCVVGAGPSGMCALYQFGQIEGAPEVVCYEKQSTWNGMWTFTWMTGTDKFGEPCHGGMYKNLWSNGPKECLEFPDYTFEHHFGKAIPSFPPRAVLHSYLEGRWTKGCKADLKKMIKFNYVVRFVRYDKNTDKFCVTVTDLKSKITKEELYTHVIVASGIFNVPNMPEIDGIDQFLGRVIHSHNFRHAEEFKGQRLLVVGASYSAEDIAIQCMKYGAKSVICTWRTKPMGFKFPEGIEERPLVQRFDKNTATFKDGSTADFDAVVLATGYRYYFPFLDDDLRLESTLSVYPDNVYKGTLWTKGGNRKLFYLGIHDQYYSYTMFDAQAQWACKFIMGTLPKEIMSISDADMKAHVKEWVERRKALTDAHGDIDVQSDFIYDLCQDSGYNSDVTKSREMFHTWEDHRDENIATYRDQSFTSIFTGNPSPINKVPWFKAYDDSVEAFVRQ